ncbi:hypothetical protein C8R42DRAFT_717302 [Lentinula raphanica]|nr:hypothetical protein C8R42DRAFT_717302 [Lentinula raphanica]
MEDNEIPSIETIPLFIRTRNQVTETRFRTPEPPESVNPESQPPPSTPRSHSQPLPFRSYPDSNFTPASKVKAAVSPEFRAASKVETRRKLILESDVPKMIPEIPWQDYFDRILPPLPKQLEGKVEDVLRRLEANGTILRDRWKAFPVDPALANENEQTVFHRLTQVYDAVVDAATQIDNALRPTFGLVVNGNVAMQSDRGTSVRSWLTTPITDPKLVHQEVDYPGVITNNGF